MEINFIKHFILNEGNNSDEKLSRVKLNYSMYDLEPVISQDTMNYHYGKLYKTYVDRFNNKEGDVDFNEAGAFLHQLYFEQFSEPKAGNKPFDESAEFLDKHFPGTGFDELKEVFEQEAMKIQGSGWVYWAKNGQIKTIKNHAKRSDIILLIDWWEHAWALDYQADKSKYLENIWKIIDWSVINRRLSNNSG